MIFDFLLMFAVVRLADLNRNIASLEDHIQSMQLRAEEQEREGLQQREFLLGEKDRLDRSCKQLRTEVSGS